MPQLTMPESARRSRGLAQFQGPGAKKEIANKQGSCMLKLANFEQSHLPRGITMSVNLRICRRWFDFWRRSTSQLIARRFSAG